MAKITSEQLSLMVSDIIQEVDYDIWKELYIVEEDDPEADLINGEVIGIEDIAESHLNLMGVYVK